jgi:hypothetical protein
MGSGLYLGTLYHSFLLALMDAFNCMSSGTSEIDHIEIGALGVSVWWLHYFEFHYKLPENSKVKRTQFESTGIKLRMPVIRKHLG